nr:helitron helicase-like domain-containing protein [Tanacetum cinerariifolium]
MSDLSDDGLSDLDDIDDLKMIMQQVQAEQEQEEEVERVRHRNYIYRERLDAEERLMADYFGPNPKYPEGRGPYVFKVSSHIYHWIGGSCPDEADPSRFLQLYIFDTDNEIANRMRAFGGEDGSGLRRDIVEGLIEFLDNNNALV